LRFELRIALFYYYSGPDARKYTGKDLFVLVFSSCCSAPE
jgi:hypothetical protein